MVRKSVDIAATAKAFLESGQIEVSDHEALAAECSQIIRAETERSSKKAIELGRRFVRQARPYSGILKTSAYRAAGWANLVGGKYKPALSFYLKARALLKRDAVQRARIDRVLIDVYMYLGEFAEAHRRAKMALKTFSRQGDHDELAKTRVNYANLLHRQDRHREAYELYHAAADHFEKARIPLAAAFCYYNEANTLTQMFEFAKAAALYRKAEKIFARNGHDLRATGCRYGIAWLHMLRGDYSIALQDLADCQNGYELAAQPREVILCLLDRAEAYLGLNLHRDARRTALEAEKLARELRIDYERAKAALFRARACQAMGLSAEAKRALRTARDGFVRGKNFAFLGVVELTSLQLETNTSQRVEQLRSARRRFHRSQLPLWEATCDLQLLSEFPDDTRILRRLSNNPAVKSVPCLHVQWHTVRGDRQARRGRIREAVVSWTRACNVLDRVRAKLPPVDLRTAYLRRGNDPHGRLTAAEYEHDPKLAAAWSERRRTAGLWQVSDRMLASNKLRRQAEKSLAELASQVTALSSHIDKTSRRETSTEPDNPSLHSLREKIRHDLTRLEKTAPSKTERVESIAQQFHTVSERMPILQFHCDGSELLAFFHTRGGIQTHRYPDGTRVATQLMNQWRFLMERAPHLHRISKSDIADERQVLRHIGEWLLGPLDIPARTRRLLILPEGPVANLPWQAISVADQPLASEYELILTPSLRHYLHANKIVTRSRRIEVFVGSSEGLPHYRNECESLCDQGRRTVVHKRCLRSDWPDGKQAHLWHYTGHAELRRDNPFYSSLLLDDGPMFAADFRLRQNKVNLVTLAACRTGQHSFQPGEESTGLVRSILEMGARNVVASQWAVTDLSTTKWMNEFYQRFLSGENVPSAVRKTALTIRNTYPSAYHWAAFSVFGAG